MSYSQQKSETKTPEELTQQQLLAYNARDLEAFIIPYPEDIKAYNFPNNLLFKGKEAMRKAISKCLKK